MLIIKDRTKLLMRFFSHGLARAEHRLLVVDGILLDWIRKIPRQAHERTVRPSSFVPTVCRTDSQG